MRFFSNISVFFACLSLVLITNLAHARDSLSGSWQEEYSETIVSVEQWSPDCGPTPKSTGRRKRRLKFKLVDQGIALKFISPNKTFSTADCQTNNKAVQPKERTVKKKLFMISCSTAEDSNPYENGLYSFRVESPEKIYYRETTRFSRNASGSMCVHTMRVRRVYKKIAEETIVGNKLSDKNSKSDDTPALESTTPKPSQDTSASHNPCKKPGPVVSVFVEPSHLELIPGSKACVEINASDSNACQVRANMSWAVIPPPKGVTIDSGRCLKISKYSHPGKYKLSLKAGGLGVALSLTILNNRSTNASNDSKQSHRLIKSSAQERTRFEADAGIPDDGAPKYGTPDTGLVKDERDKEDTPGPAKIKKSSLQDFSLSTDGVSAPKQDLPSWLLPASVASSVFLVLIMLIIIMLSKRSNTRAKHKHLQPGEIPPKHDSETQHGTPTDPIEPIKPQTLMAPTRVEPLRAVPSKQDQQAQAPSLSEPSSCGDSASRSPTKFCIECGKTLPVEAKFCPYCAQKQD